jgi:peptidoglycan hydrolase CwlO-like protein
MSETAVTIIGFVIAALGGGGIGAAFFNYLLNREVKRADVYRMLSQNYETRLTALTKRATQLETRVMLLEDTIASLRLEVDERDDMIDTLQRENAELKSEIKKLKAENLCKDQKIALLQDQVCELKERLDAMNSKDC